MIMLNSKNVFPVRAVGRPEFSRFPYTEIGIRENRYCFTPLHTGRNDSPPPRKRMTWKINELEKLNGEMFAYRTSNKIQEPQVHRS